MYFSNLYPYTLMSSLSSSSELKPLPPIKFVKLVAENNHHEAESMSYSKSYRHHTMPVSVTAEYLPTR